MNREKFTDLFSHGILPAPSIEQTEEALQVSTGTDPDFAFELEVNALQFEYLTEQLYLLQNNLDQPEKRIKEFLRGWMNFEFPEDEVRQAALERILNTRPIKHSSAISANLHNLFTKEVYPALADRFADTVNLEDMRSANEPTRVGDILFLPPDAHIFVIGDTHGDLASTNYIINQIENSNSLAEGTYVVFLGDYVNNGLKNWQNVVAILEFQSRYPEAVFLLNGNHEFRETYLTALREHFVTHWQRFSRDDLPASINNKLPHNDKHYGHMRLDLIRDFGIGEGERLYEAFENWAIRLPYVCLSNDLMFSHSLGKPEGKDFELFPLLNGKRDDRKGIKILGFEAWKKAKQSYHSAMVNNPQITDALVDEFGVALGINHFVVGHSHYRSGDTFHYVGRQLTTITSSSPFSPDSGHYMYYEMDLRRNQERKCKNLPPGNGQPCYLSFEQFGIGQRMMTLHQVKLESSS